MIFIFRYYSFEMLQRIVEKYVKESIEHFVQSLISEEKKRCKGFPQIISENEFDESWKEHTPETGGTFIGDDYEPHDLSYADANREDIFNKMLPLKGRRAVWAYNHGFVPTVLVPNDKPNFDLQDAQRKARAKWFGEESYYAMQHFYLIAPEIDRTKPIIAELRISNHTLDPEVWYGNHSSGRYGMMCDTCVSIIIDEDTRDADIRVTFRNNNVRINDIQIRFDPDNVTDAQTKQIDKFVDAVLRGTHPKVTLKQLEAWFGSEARFEHHGDRPTLRDNQYEIPKQMGIRHRPVKWYEKKDVEEDLQIPTSALPKENAPSRPFEVAVELYPFEYEDRLYACDENVDTCYLLKSNGEEICKSDKTTYVTVEINPKDTQVEGKIPYALLFDVVENNQPKQFKMLKNLPIFEYNGKFYAYDKNDGSGHAVCYMLNSRGTGILYDKDVKIVDDKKMNENRLHRRTIIITENQYRRLLRLL